MLNLTVRMNSQQKTHWQIRLVKNRKRFYFVSCLKTQTKNLPYSVLFKESVEGTSKKYIQGTVLNSVSCHIVSLHVADNWTREILTYNRTELQIFATEQTASKLIFWPLTKRQFFLTDKWKTGLTFSYLMPVLNWQRTNWHH